jgi:hypothetical protein
MARPRMNTRQWIEDYFAEMPVDGQAVLLQVLTAIHRQATRKTEQPKMVVTLEPIEE